MKLVKNTKLFVDLTNIMVVHIMNNEIGCFNQFVLREYSFFFFFHKTALGLVSSKKCELSSYFPDDSVPI